MTLLMSKAAEPTPANAKVKNLASLLNECQGDLRQEFQDSKIFTSCILEFVFSDCLLQETIIDNCDKFVSVESILETLCGMVTML